GRVWLAQPERAAVRGAPALGIPKISGAVAELAACLLTGDGGDAVFLGYPRHRHLWMAGKVPVWLRPGLRGVWHGLRRGFPRKGQLRRMAAFADYASGDIDAFFNARLWLQNPRLKALLGD